jgi:hypothetical protein
MPTFSSLVQGICFQNKALVWTCGKKLKALTYVSSQVDAQSTLKVSNMPKATKTKVFSFSFSFFLDRTIKILELITKRVGGCLGERHSFAEIKGLYHGGYIVTGIFIGNPTHFIIFYCIAYISAVMLVTNPHGHMDTY